MAEKGKICFVIAPIGEKGSAVHKRSDQILQHIIRPAAEECGYTAIRADEISAPGTITDQVITHVIEDPMVVADLTDWNPNVFYELAIRHAVRQPFVLLFQPMPHKERIPFDVAGLRVLDLDYPDWDSMTDSRAKLIEAIKAAEATEADKLVTPISQAINLQQLAQSENPIAAMLAEVGGSLSRLEQRLIFIESDLVSGLGLERSTAQRWEEMNRYWAQKKKTRDQLYKDLGEHWAEEGKQYRDAATRSSAEGSEK